MFTKKEIIKQRTLFSESDKTIVAAFKVLSDLNRYRILRMLAEQKELTVSRIAQVLDISLPLASQHIRILTHAKLVQKERAGKNVYPKLEHGNPFVQAVIKTINQALKQ